MNPEFEVHMLNKSGKEKAQVIASAFDKCLQTLKDVCTEGPEFVLCKQRLEEACFYAKKSMAKYSQNQDFGDEEE